MGVTHSQRGFTLSEVLLAVSVVLFVLLVGLASLSARSAQARSAALVLQAMVGTARTLAAANAGSSAAIGSASGATVAVTFESGHTVARLYAGRPIDGVALPADGHTPPFITDAEISVVSGSAALPPFAILISSSGYAQLVASYTVNSNLPVSATSCPSSGYTLRFSAGWHSEDHKLSCEDASLRTNN